MIADSLNQMNIKLGFLLVIDLIIIKYWNNETGKESYTCTTSADGKLMQL